MAWRKRRGKLREIAEGLAKMGAIRFGPHTLPSGRESAYEINLNGLPSHPGLYRIVVESMAELTLSKSPRARAICGLPVSGLALSAPVAFKRGLPLVWSRRTIRPGERRLEGELKPGWRVAVVDDVASSGRTILDAARVIEQEGGEVKDGLVVIDRQEGARERLSKEGIALHSLTDIVELADILHAMELIDDSDLRSITRSVGGRQ